MRLQFRFSDSGRVWQPSLFNFTAPRLRVKWTPRNMAWLVVIAGLLMILAGAGFETHAQGVPLTNANAGIFDNIQEQYMQKAVKWEAGLRSIALSLFGGLAVISIAWTMIKLVLQKNELTAFIPTMAMQLLTLGFFLYLVEQGTWIATMVLQSFEAAGQRVGGVGTITPSYVVMNGFDCVFRIIEKVVDMSFSDSVAIGLPLVGCGIFILAAFVGVAILLLVTYIESYFVLYGGIVLLGFGALPWTRDIPKNYLIYAINVGVKLFVLSLVVSIGVEFSSDWPTMILNSKNDLIMHNTLYLGSGAAVFVAVAWKVPSIAAAISSGSVNFNASDVLGTTAAAAGVGAAAGALATGGASTVASGLKGAVQAGAAGTSLAAQQGSSGLGAAIKGLGHAASAAASEAGSAVKAGVGVSPPSSAAVDGRGRNVDNLGTRAANKLHQQVQNNSETAAAAPVQSQQPASTATAAAADPVTTGPSAGGANSADAGKPNDGAGSNAAVTGSPATGGAGESMGAGRQEERSVLQTAEANASPAASPSGTQGPTVGLSDASAPAAAPSAAGLPAAGAPAGPVQPAPPSRAGNASQGSRPDPQFQGAKNGGSTLKPPPLPPSDAASGGVSINIQATDD